MTIISIASILELCFPSDISLTFAYHVQTSRISKHLHRATKNLLRISISPPPMKHPERYHVPTLLRRDSTSHFTPLTLYIFLLFLILLAHLLPSPWLSESGRT